MGPFLAPSVDAPSTLRGVGYARCLRARAGTSPPPNPAPPRSRPSEAHRGAARCKHWMDRRKRGFATGGRTRPTGSVGRTAVSARRGRSSRTRTSPGWRATGSGSRTTAATATGGWCARGWRTRSPPEAPGSASPLGTIRRSARKGLSRVPARVAHTGDGTVPGAGYGLPRSRQEGRLRTEPGGRRAVGAASTPLSPWRC